MSLMEMISRQLQGGGIETIARQVGVKPEQASQVVSGALPMILGGLAKNSGSSGGASALAGALDRDHDGSVLDDLAGFLGGGAAEKMGGGILRHVLGGRQSAAQSSLSKMSGVDSSKVGQILAMLAPLVMGALGRQKRSQGLDSGALAGMLGGERRSMEKASPGLGGLLGGLLDSDGDGSAMDDVAASLGKGLLGSLFGKK